MRLAPTVRRTRQRPPVITSALPVPFPDVADAAVRQLAHSCAAIAAALLALDEQTLKDHSAADIRAAVVGAVLCGTPLGDTLKMYADEGYWHTKAARDLSELERNTATLMRSRARDVEWLNRGRE